MIQRGVKNIPGDKLRGVSSYNRQPIEERAKAIGTSIHRVRLLEVNRHNDHRNPEVIQVEAARLDTRRKKARERQQVFHKFSSFETVYRLPAAQPSIKSRGEEAIALFRLTREVEVDQDTGESLLLKAMTPRPSVTYIKLKSKGSLYIVYGPAGEIPGPKPPPLVNAWRNGRVWTAAE